MNCKKLIILFFVTVCHFGQLKSQDAAVFLPISFHTEYATLLPHHKMMYPLAEQKFFNFRSDFQFMPNVTKPWQSAYNFPEMGITALYSQLSSPSDFGNAFAVLPFMKFSFLTSKKIHQQFYFGCGMAYLTKKFDRLDNFKNIAIGSHFNAALRIFYALQIPLSRHISAETGFGITHFSNGAMALPNRGANQMSLSIGFKYMPKPILSNEKVLDTSFFMPNFMPDFYFFSGIKQLYIGDNTKYFAFTSGFSLSYNYRKYKAGIAGLDFFYDASDRSFYKDIGIDYPSVSFIKTGFFIGHKWIFGKLSFAVNFGTYLYAKNRVGDAGNFYNRLVLRYEVSPKIELNSSMKAHFAKADYIEWGVVFKPFNSFNLKTKK